MEADSLGLSSLGLAPSYTPRSSTFTFVTVCLRAQVGLLARDL